MANLTDKKYRETLDYIYNLHSSKSILGLERIKKALKNLGSPEKSFKSIHVAGTNGKGSVVAMISSVLKESGLKVGMYTSPHLVDFRERIQINGRKITKKDVVELSEEIKNIDSDMTYFEFVTAMAFLYFKKKKVDYGVIEVGLGGRIDATNVILPELCVITNVSNDHEEILGSHVEQIAAEKAGIIKEGIPVVTDVKDGVKIVVWDYAKSMNAPFITVEDKAVRLDVSDEKQVIEISGKKYGLPLLGNFQLDNVSIALKALEILKNDEKKITEKSIKSGIEKTKWPGRMQVISRNPLIIIDGAHNIEGVRSLINSIKSMYEGKIVPVIGIKKTKNYREMLKEFEKIADFIIFSKSNVEPADPKELLECVSGHGIAVEDIRKAIGFAKYLCRDEGMILITGSLYFVGNVMEQLKIKA
ncbi:MAG: bifunctional folylpolyglutamate synthase/dihydrofolate synthase [Candidatus Aenigmarchaeota archaeon]|nr:bifunctional folylpolyglutamate synthase/dihydrofolate synthase [Candidatus Aenigmarchaeota archaeon]